MILKGNQRGGGQQLAAHLLNSFDNERVEIVDVRGAIAQDLSGAFAEWAAEARGTNCQKFLYSLSLNPDQTQGQLTREQYLELLERTERSLKLVGQPRAVVFHEKRDKDGVLREHCHAVWSRIDTDRMKAVQISHDRLKLRSVAQDFAQEYGIELPEGMKRGKSRDSRTDRFNNRAKQENLGEKQQQERTGVPKAQRMEEIAACWRETKTGAEFIQALEDKAYYLARGDSRDYVVVDLYGQVHSLSRQLVGVAKSKDLKERLAGYTPDKQPDVESAKAYARQKLQERQKALDAAAPEEGDKKKNVLPGDQASLEQRQSALQARQEERRAALDKQGAALFLRQFAERGALREIQASENAGLAAARLEKQPKGLAALITRITGIRNFVAWAQGKADSRRAAAQKQQMEMLLGRHDRELKEMNRHYHALTRLEARENRSAANAGLREGFRALRQRTFALRPEFDKALSGERKTATTEAGGRTRANLFNRLAGAVGLTKGDFEAAFERATAARTKASDDAGTGGHAPKDADALDRARQLREDLLRRQPGRDDPDRER
jgi:hypothetical protein